MSNVITGAEYAELATKYGLLIRSLSGVSDYMYDALTIVAGFSDVYPTLDLIVPFNNVYLQQTSALNSSSQFLEVVRALNSHVLNRARDTDGVSYTDINNWFDDQNLGAVITEEWADMSASVGQTIDSGFIE